MPVRAAAPVAIAALAGQAVLLAVLLRYPNLTTFHQAEWLMEAALPLWILALVAFARLAPTPRQAVLWVLGAGVVLNALAVLHPPTTSDDDYRYMWDAKVQFSGVDPYRYTPAAPELAPLRTPNLFGAPDHCGWPYPGGCTSINRPTVHTIYPPVAEAAFDAVHAVSFGGRGNHLPLQLVGALGSLAIGWLLLRRSPSRPWLAAVWTWCPITVVEYANNAHIDWLAILLVLVAFGRRSLVAAGALVGAAIAVKLYPALVLPSLVRRSRAGMSAAVAAVAVVALVYVPHVLAVGSAVIGYLPGYLHEEKYGNGDRLLILHAVFPHPVDTGLGVLVLLALAAWAVWTTNPALVAAPERSAVVVVGVAFLVFTPNFGWYAGLLLVLVAMTGALEWLPIVVAATFAYLVHTDHDEAIYLVAGLLTLAMAVARNVDSLRGWLRSISPGTARSPSSPSTPRR